MKKRIDRLLVERGLAESREKAQALIMAGNVLIDEQPATKSGIAVREDDQKSEKHAQEIEVVLTLPVDRRKWKEGGVRAVIDCHFRVNAIVPKSAVDAPSVIPISPGAFAVVSVESVGASRARPAGSSQIR